jgi:hypothetical protein
MSAHRTRPATAAVTAAGVALLVLAGCGGSSGGSSSSSASTSASATTPAPGSTATQAAPATLTGPDTVTGSAAGVLASMHASTHHPRVNRPWPLRFTVTSGGRPVHASVDYEFVFGGQVVAHRSHYTFDGHFSDIALWPASAVGYPLTFRAVVRASGASINLDYAVKVTP